MSKSLFLFLTVQYGYSTIFFVKYTYKFNINKINRLDRTCVCYFGLGIYMLEKNIGNLDFEIKKVLENYTDKIYKQPIQPF